MAKKLRKPAVAARYGDVDTRTIDRWVADPRFNFPKPIFINDIPYWDESQLEAWDRSCAAEGRRRRVPRAAQMTERETDAA